MILVMGATGNVGSELVGQLAHANQPIRVFTRDERKVVHLDKSIERAIGDFDQPETLKKAVRGVEKIFLVTAETRQDINVIEAAWQAGVKHIVKISTDEVLWPDLLIIGRWNLEREKVLETSGLAWTILRPGQFMSNALRWTESVKKQNVVIFPGGKGKTAPIDPADIAAVAKVALTQPGHEGKHYSLTGSELLTTAEQVQILSRMLGKRLRYINPPLFVARFFMRRAGLNPKLVDGLLTLAKAAAQGKFEYCNDMVAQITGQAPRTFEQWCQAHIDVFR